MALVAPLLMVVMFGAMELGYYFYCEHVLVKAVRDGARFASRAGFDKFDCSAAPDGIDATLKAQTQRVTRTNQVATGGTARLPGWTDDTSVEVQIKDPCDTSGSYGSFYTGLTGGIPVVVVSADVPYRSVFSTLGFNATVLHLKAQSEVTVMGG